MNRESATVVILPVVIDPRACERRVRPDVLPENVIRFPGFWYTRGRNDDPLRRGLPDNIA